MDRPFSEEAMGAGAAEKEWERQEQRKESLGQPAQASPNDPSKKQRHDESAALSLSAKHSPEARFQSTNFILGKPLVIPKVYTSDSILLGKFETYSSFLEGCILDSDRATMTAGGNAQLVQDILNHLSKTVVLTTFAAEQLTKSEIKLNRADAMLKEAEEKAVTADQQIMALKKQLEASEVRASALHSELERKSREFEAKLKMAFEQSSDYYLDGFKLAKAEVLKRHPTLDLSDVTFLDALKAIRANVLPEDFEVQVGRPPQHVPSMNATS